MSKYTFQTIVATSETRAAFTAKREEFNTADKPLMEALFLTADWDKVKEKLDEIKGNFGRKKKEKAATETVEEPAEKETPIEKLAKKAAKRKAAKKEQEPTNATEDVVVVIDQSDA